MSNETILIVDDESSIIDTLQAILRDEGYQTLTAKSAEEAMSLLHPTPPAIDAVLLDIWMPGMDGLTLLDWLKAHGHEFPIIMMSGHGNIETAVRATKKGAYDFIEKPLSLEKLLLILGHALKEMNLRRENQELKRQVFAESATMVGQSEAIQKVQAEIQMAAPSDGSVLITGENGTGKELVARQIHLNSPRRDKPFVAINCAAIPDDLIESELFGYEPGAFPGAVKPKIGKFEMAQGGTLFLDEVADMSLKTQAKILRILQELKFERLGGSTEQSLNLRIIAASNKNLENCIQQGTFREDLYYRINVIPIHIPPLRERSQDIPLLVEYFATQYADSNGIAGNKKISSEAMESLLLYRWPGNIRELKNIVERMVIMVNEPEIQLHHVPPVIRLSNAEMIQVKNLPKELNAALLAFEAQFVEEKLKKHHWNLEQAATELALNREELQGKIILHKITVPASEN